jgi:hypothetical protein
MTANLSVGVVILTLAPALVAAQNPVSLSSDDLYFTAQRLGGALPDRGGPVAMVRAPTRMCGFQIHGNHRSRANPRVEWDINIDEINIDAGRIVGVTAGVFDVVGKERKARPAIVDLSFSIEGSSQVIPARIVGAPNPDNGIKAVLQTDSGDQLFDALSNDAHLVTIALKYADNNSDVLQIRADHDWRVLGGGKNSLFNQCLRGYTPVGPTRAIP